MFSGGACSFLAAHRWASAGNRPVLLFADTGKEDEDLHRFVNECADFLGCELVTVSASYTFEGMVLRNHALPSDRMPFCSRELKVEPSMSWINAHPEITDAVLGIDWTEPHRFPKVQRLWEPLGLRVHAPMMDKPYLTKPQMLQTIRDLGIEPPRLYALGFQHNNCGGACVRNGLRAWRHLASVNPERLEEWAKIEDLIPGYTFAKDRRGGGAKPITLRQIAAEASLQGELDWGGCGCFVDDFGENTRLPKETTLDGAALVAGDGVRG